MSDESENDYGFVDHSLIDPHCIGTRVRSGATGLAGRITGVLFDPDGDPFYQVMWNCPQMGLLTGHIIHYDVNLI